MKSALRAPARRLVAWVRAPFASLYRVAAAVLAAGAVCLALPPWVGLLLFAPVAAVVGVKVAHAVRAVASLCYVGVAENREGHPSLDVRRDLLQRSRALGAASVAAGVAVLLAVRAALAVFPGLAEDGVLAPYLAFTAVLLGGFLLFYTLALRFDSSVLRGLTSIAVTLPVFFIVVAVASILLSWAMDVLAGLGVPAEGLLQGGFAWLYEMQRLLGAAVGYFLRQDTLIVGVSIVAAALLLLLYTYSVPLYWLRSVSRWLKGIGVAAAAFGAAVIVFAGVWLADVQHLAEQGAAGHLGAGLDAGVASSQAQAIAQYRSDDLVALIKAFVLPYTVGVFVANGVVAWRKGRAKQTADGILDGFAAAGHVDEAALSGQRKRYLYCGGSPTLWDIALRSIGHDVPLPHPFAPRKLTLKERLTGVLEDPPPERAPDPPPERPPDQPAEQPADPSLSSASSGLPDEVGMHADFKADHAEGRTKRNEPRRALR